MDNSLAAFIAISIAVIVTPGQDTALTIRNTLLGGRRGGIATAAGVAGGQLVWTIAASAGIGSVLRRPRVRRTIDAVTGTILVAFGLRVAAEPS